MDFETLRYETRDRIASITLDRPRVRNAQSRILLEELDAAFAQAVADNDVRVIVLGGAGEHFSSGHDLGTEQELADAEARPYPSGMRGDFERSWSLYVENSLRWRELPKPTLAAVQGYCIFGGYLIATVMDLIIAADDAKFLPAHLQHFSAPWDLGIRKAKEVLFENRFIDASEALELGLANRVVPRAELEAEAFAQAERIAQTDPLTLRMTKFSINQAQDAMGYRFSTQAAHSNFMVLAAAGKVRKGDERRLKGVGRALGKAEPNPGDSNRD
jgi:enoyl-CoA hydratase